MLESLQIFFHLQYENGYSKIHQLISFFKIHIDMTTFIIQSNKIVSNEVRQLSATRAVVQKKA